MARCSSTCPHDDRCSREAGHDGGHSHAVCPCNQANADRTYEDDENPIVAPLHQVVRAHEPPQSLQGPAAGTQMVWTQEGAAFAELVKLVRFIRLTFPETLMELVPGEAQYSEVVEGHALKFGLPSAPDHWLRISMTPYGLFHLVVWQQIDPKGPLYLLDSPWAEGMWSFIRACAQPLSLTRRVGALPTEPASS